jgi:hypothetical protein
VQAHGGALFEPSHVHVSSASQVPADPKVHKCVQKNVVLLPITEHSGALDRQSLPDVQNLPTPSGSPVSPGSPHCEANVSIVLIASTGLLLLLLHAMKATSKAVHMLRICCV